MSVQPVRLNILKRGVCDILKKVHDNLVQEMEVFKVLLCFTEKLRRGDIGFLKNCGVPIFRVGKVGSVVV